MTISGVEKRATVNVSVQSLLDGKTYEGGFTFRRPTFEDIGAISAGQSRLTQGETLVDMAYAAVIRAIAELSIVVEDAPKWWYAAKDNSDVSVVMAVNAQYLRWKNKNPFRKDEDKEPVVDEKGDSTVR